MGLVTISSLPPILLRTLRARKKNRERLGIKITDDLQFIEVIVKTNE